MSGAQQGIRWSDAAGEHVEPMVPPAALMAIVRFSFGDSSSVSSVQNRARLHRQYERLRELALQGGPYLYVANRKCMSASFVAPLEWNVLGTCSCHVMASQSHVHGELGTQCLNACSWLNEQAAQVVDF